jgi:hypothetical protein
LPAVAKGTHSRESVSQDGSSPVHAFRPAKRHKRHLQKLRECATGIIVCQDSKRHMAAVRSMLESQSERSKTYALTKKDTPIADAAVARRQ